MVMRQDSQHYQGYEMEAMDYGAEPQGDYGMDSQLSQVSQLSQGGYGNDLSIECHASSSFGHLRGGGRRKELGRRKGGERMEEGRKEGLYRGVRKEGNGKIVIGFHVLLVNQLMKQVINSQSPLTHSPPSPSPLNVWPAIPYFNSSLSMSSTNPLDADSAPLLPP